MRWRKVIDDKSQRGKTDLVCLAGKKGADGDMVAGSMLQNGRSGRGGRSGSWRNGVDDRDDGEESKQNRAQSVSRVESRTGQSK